MSTPTSPFNANNHPSDMADEAAAPQQSSNENKTSALQHCLDALGYALFGLLVIIFIPFYILYAIAAYFFFDFNALGDLDDDDEERPVTTPANKGLFQKAQEFQQTAKVEAKLISAIWIRLLILSLIWLVLSLSIPVLRNKTLLGSKLWRWTLLLMAVCCGYPLLSVLTRMLLYLLSTSDQFKARKNVVYFSSGLRRTLNWIVLFGSVLITWMCYFEKRAEDDDSRVLLNTGTWTLVTVLVGTMLWLVKNVLLLKWEADAMYRRFSERILRVGFQLYFLARIDGRRFDEFQPTRGGASDDRPPDGDEEDQDNYLRSSNSSEFSFGGGQGFNYPASPQMSHTRSPDVPQMSQRRRATVPAYPVVPQMRSPTVVVNPSDRARRKKKEREEQKRRRAKQILLRASEEATTYDIKQKAKYFQYLYVVSSREGDGISDLLTKFNHKIPRNRNTPISRNDLMEHFGLDEDDTKVLYSDELQAEDDVRYDTFEKWMLKAHKNCLMLGYTLSDAKGVASVLNKVLTGFLIIVVTVTWLLLTKTAKTDVLILIASPFLAATFVFGETCRRIFEGVVFSFISHPFDVGDRCIIDGIELEVKHMNVLTTTFIKIGLTSEEAFYPNSALATKSIINLKGDPDPEDIVELTLEPNSTTKPALDILQSNIKRFLDGDERYEHENHSIVVKEIGNSIKLMIHYRHVLSIQEVTHMQCFEKKIKQRSELLLRIKQFLDAENIKVSESNCCFSSNVRTILREGH